VKLVIMADTHGRHEEFSVPTGDVFIHAGDFTATGHPYAVAKFNEWLGCLPHRYKIVVAGNHELEWSEKKAALLSNAIYLQDSGTEIEGVKFWGSPWQPEFNHWEFNLPRGAELASKWALIPGGTDVLITHSPPQGILDQCHPDGCPLGCWDLMQRVEQLRPRLHIFGHVHGGYGSRQWNGTKFINAAMLDEAYENKKRAIFVEEI
jgi:predicted phosphohydrolase